MLLFLLLILKLWYLNESLKRTYCLSRNLLSNNTNAVQFTNDSVVLPTLLFLFLLNSRRRKGRCMHSCHKHHHHNHHHHHHHRHDLDPQLFHHHHHHCDGIVRQEEPIRSEEWPQNPRPVPYLGGHILTAALQR